MNLRRREDRYIGVVHADAFLCSPASERAAANEPQYHRQLREALEVPRSGVLQYRDFSSNAFDDEEETRSRSPDSMLEVTPGMGLPGSPPDFSAGRGGGGGGVDGEAEGGCSTPRNQGAPSPYTSPQKPLWTPVRDGMGGAGRPTGRTPQRPPSQHTTPTLHRGSGPRKDTIQALRILDADGIASDPETHVLCWGNRSALVVGIRGAAYRWSTSGVECLLDAQCNVTCTAASCDDDMVGDGYAAVGLDNGLVHVFRFDHAGCQKPFGPPIGETLAKITALYVQDGMLFVGDASGVFAMHSLVYRQAVFRTALSCAVRRIAVTTDGNHIAVGLQDSLLVFHRSSMQSPTPVRLPSLSSTQRLELDLSCSAPSGGEGSGSGGRSFWDPVTAVAWFERPEMLSTLVYGTGTGTVVVHSLGSGVVACLEMGCKILAIVTSRTSDEFAVSLGAAMDVDHYHDSATVFVVQLKRCELSRGSGAGACAAKLRRVVKLEGHSMPVLHMALSPKGDQLATAAGQGDDTLRMWAAFPPSAPSHRITNAFDEELR